MFARRKPEMRKNLGPEPFVTVVLPVRNEERFIADTLDQLRQQRYPQEQLEFLVCDGRSEDRTREIVTALATEDPRIVLLDNPGIKSSSGRNVGFRRAKGEIIVVVDGHVEIPDERLIENLVECFRQSGADSLGRPQPLIAQKGRPWSEAIAFARASPLGHHPNSMIYSEYEGFAPASSMGAAYRRHVFERIGFVDESFDACEDLEFNTRLDKAGLSCFTSAKLTVRYFARSSPARLFQQLHRYGIGRLRYLLRYPDRLTLGQLAAPTLAASLLSFPILVLFARPLGSAVGIVLAFYLLAVMAGALRLASRTKWRHLPRYLVVFPVIHLAVGAGVWSGLLGLLRHRSGRRTSPVQSRDDA